MTQMRRGRPRPWHGGLRRRVAMVASAVLLGALLPAGVAEALDPSAQRPQVTEADRPVAGHPVKGMPRPSASPATGPKGGPAAAWPTAGSASGTVPAVGARTALRGLPMALRAPARTAAVARTATAATAAVGSAQVTVQSRSAAQRAGVDGMLFTARRADARPTAGQIGLDVDYGRYAQGYGGDYGARLRLVRLPACALTTPGVASCRVQTPVAAVNDSAHQRLTAAAVPLAAAATPSALSSAAAPQATVLAVTAGASSDGGDYQATSLSPSASWQTNLNSGSYTWSYDMSVPPVPGGLAPQVGLTYDSGQIDGRTSNTNNQASWAGDGFDLWPGYIERSYKSCADDGVAADANGVKPGDECWGYDNATLSLNGKGGQLVPAGTNVWKLKNDDGTRVEHLNGSSSDVRDNGDNDQEYWRVTTTDGTQYYFGYNKLPGWASGNETTDSTWTVPVFGNDAGEPCHDTTFASSWCQQAYRWNLDYVVNTHGDAVAYYYDKETNYYGRDLKASDGTAYTRGGTLDRIEYGLRGSAVYTAKPLAKVTFGSSERCLPQSGVTCAADTIGSQSFYWYDTPWDQNCDQGKDCTSLSPTFWTRKRLTSVTTSVLNSSGTYSDVDSWALDHSWGMADIDYQLLLNSVQHTGKSATPSVTLPKVQFSYEQDANRLDKDGDGTAPFIKDRLHTVIDESNGQIDVNYSAPACDWNNLPTPETNTTRCFPQYSVASGDANPSLQWFNKYVVTSVTQTDRTNSSPDMVTTYDYLGDAAWHYADDDGLTKEKYKTWSQWRGYRHVRVDSGDTTAMASQTDHWYLRGMNGDRLNTSGGTKTVTLDNGEGATLSDWEALAGFEYRTESYSAPGGSVLSKTVNHGWFHQSASETHSWGTVTANVSGTDRTDTYTSLDDGAGAKWRQTTVKNTMENTAGRITQTEDLGQTDLSGDDHCTRTTFAENTAENLLTLPARVETVAVDCSTTPDRRTQVISDVRTAYDGTSYTASPTKGDALYSATLKSHDGTTGTYLESGATYDQYGRQLTATDLTANVTATNTGTPARTPRTDGLTSTTAYTPTTGIPTGMTLTTPPLVKGTPSTAMTTTTTLEPLRGLQTSVSDTNTHHTDYTYDALGRTLKTWLADRSANHAQTPNYEYTYSITPDSPMAVATRTVDNDGSQDTSYTLYDGFLRPRQVQTPGPNGGMLAADTFYDGRGLVAKEFAPYYVQTAPSPVLSGVDKALSVETQTWHTYDGLGRETLLKHVAGNGDGGQVLDTTSTVYGGDRTTVIPPTGGTTTTTLTDARGQQSEVWQYPTALPTGTPDKTLYTYTPTGKPDTVTDADGNKWSYTYDQLGRMTRSSDPDKGVTTIAYDDRDRVLTSTDSRASGNTLAFVYDTLGRQLEEHAGSTTGPMLASWAYDAVAGAKGQLSSSTRYDGGNAYTTTVNAYDALYRVTRSTTVIPAAEGALAGSYQQNTKYNPDGTVIGTSFPAEGSLPAESMVTTYDAQHRPVAVSGTGTYLTGVSYSDTGKPEQYELGITGGNKSWVTDTYEWGTQRLETSRVDRYGIAGVDRYTTYGYDQEGNVLSVSDTSRDGTDNQCFRYDGLQRLTEAWAQGTATCVSGPSAGVLGGPAPYWQSFTYKPSGLRDTETDHDPGGNTASDVSKTYHYPAPGQPRAHTLTGVDTAGPGGATSKDSYVYDEMGDTTTRDVGGDSQTLKWDAEGHLQSVTGTSGTTSYLYDTHGNRLIQRAPGATTLYLGSAEITLPTGAAKPKATRYYDLTGGIQAVRTDDNKVSFVVPDHQGTGQLAIDGSTLALQQRRTTPFGSVRGNAPTSWPGDKGFVGGTDDATGLTHLGAREYDPETGRFLSVDPVLDTTDPQSLTGYAYSDNNPVRFSDPAGTEIGSKPNSCQYDLKYCDKKTQKAVGYDPKTGTATPPPPPAPTPAQVQKAWIKKMTPSTRKEGKLLSWWSGFTGLNTTGPYWDPQINGKGAGHMCFGLLGCSKAMEYLQSHPGKVDKAKEIAATYCVDHLHECENDARGYQIGQDLWGSVTDIILAREGMKGRTAGETVCSFTGTTKVLLADGTTKRIKDVTTADRVAAADTQEGSGRNARAVVGITVHRDDDLLDVAVRGPDGATTILHTTQGHPFWDATRNSWVSAGDLLPGHLLDTPSGQHATVAGLKPVTGAADMYNLTVDGLHTYYVLTGTTPVLVHNDGGYQVPDDFIIARGGTKPMPGPGETFSGNMGSDEMEAGGGLPHGQIRVTTAGAIRAAGGTVDYLPEPVADGSAINYNHVDVTMGDADPFSELQANPVPKAMRLSPEALGGPRC